MRYIKMEIVVISREMVKPSTPTPSSLYEYQLSFLDQMNGPIFLPILFFYQTKSNSNIDKSNVLKKSLSETLAKFYPLAGRLKECQRYINCSDEGVEVTEAKVKCLLSEVLDDQPDLAIYNELLPRHPVDYAENVPMLVQLNFFKCGGMVIAIKVCHKVMDGLSIARFVNYWATITRGIDDDVIVPPRLDLARLIPPRNIPDRGFDILRNTFLAKRFVFNKDAIYTLRDRYATSHLRPSRVEAVATFVLCRLVGTTYKVTDPRKVYEVTQAVSICNRMDPPVPEPYVGNLYGSAAVRITLEKGTTEEARVFLTRMRDAVRKFDGNFVKNYLEEIYIRKRERKNNPQPNRENLVGFSFTSAAGFPIYTADFGWGKPIWFTLGKNSLGTAVMIYPMRSGDGFEVIVKLKENDMVKLESDEEFRAFTSQKSRSKLKLLSSL